MQAPPPRHNGSQTDGRRLLWALFPPSILVSVGPAHRPQVWQTLPSQRPSPPSLLVTAAGPSMDTDPIGETREGLSAGVGGAGCQLRAAPGHPCRVGRPPRRGPEGTGAESQP